jgi:hypothetical protein
LVIGVKGAGPEEPHHRNIGVVRAPEFREPGIGGGDRLWPALDLHPALDEAEGGLFDDGVGRQSRQHVFEHEGGFAGAAEVAVGGGDAKAQGGVEGFGFGEVFGFPLEAVDQAFELQGECFLAG